MTKKQYKKEPIVSKLLKTDDYEMENVNIEKLFERFVIKDSRCTIVIDLEQIDQLRLFLNSLYEDE